MGSDNPNLAAAETVTLSTFVTFPGTCRLYRKSNVPKMTLPCPPPEDVDAWVVVVPAAAPADPAAPGNPVLPVVPVEFVVLNGFTWDTEPFVNLYALVVTEPVGADTVN